jgi:hypothetical protein
LSQQIIRSGVGRTSAVCLRVDNFAEQLGPERQREPQHVIQAVKGNCLFRTNNHDAFPQKERAGPAARR